VGVGASAQRQRATRGDDRVVGDRGADGGGLDVDRHRGRNRDLALVGRGRVALVVVGVVAGFGPLVAIADAGVGLLGLGAPELRVDLVVDGAVAGLAAVVCRLAAAGAGRRGERGERRAHRLEGDGTCRIHVPIGGRDHLVVDDGERQGGADGGLAAGRLARRGGGRGRLLDGGNVEAVGVERRRARTELRRRAVADKAQAERRRDGDAARGAGLAIGGGGELAGRVERHIARTGHAAVDLGRRAIGEDAHRRGGADPNFAAGGRFARRGG